MSCLTGDELRTVLDALKVAADHKRDMADWCGCAATAGADICATCSWRLSLAEAYDELAEKLEGDRQ